MMRTALIVVILSSPAALAAKPPEFLVGVQTHFRQYKGSPRLNLDMVEQSGAVAVADELTWDLVEKEKGKLEVPAELDAYVREAHQRGLRLMISLCYGNRFYANGDFPTDPESMEAYSRYCEHLVARYQGKVGFYQFWNEWVGGCGMPHGGKVEDYVRLVKHVYPRVKAIDPQAVFLGGALHDGAMFFEGRLEEMVRLGLLEACDAISFHRYLYLHPYPTSEPENWVEWMDRVAAMLREHHDGKDVPIYLTEVGWPTHLGPNGSTQERSATYLARFYLLARTIPTLRGVWWYDFQDDGWNPVAHEDHFGLVKQDLTPKRAFFAMNDIADLVAHGRFVGRMDVGDPQVWVLRFEHGGQDVWAIWSVHRDDDWQIVLVNEAEDPKPVRITQVGVGSIERGWGAADWTNHWKKYVFAPIRENEIELQVRERPWLIAGDLKAVKVKAVVRRESPERSRPSAPEVHLAKERLLVRPEADGGSWVFFGGNENWTGMGGVRHNADDLDARLLVTWTPEALHLTVVVKDDVFCQDQPPSAMWMGDSLQIGLQSLEHENPMAYTELTVGLADGEAKVYRQSGQSGQAPGPLDAVEVNATRQGGDLVYRMCIPVSEVDLPRLCEGTVIGFSLLVNDNDGEGRKGYLHWAEGIGRGKNVLAYNWLIMADD
ncbi:MAG: hypothetical protein GXY33_07350 [Phycisphaerae bacterium]|nr:hypothetical protein [Phycisphaerae bacterium]